MRIQSPVEEKPFRKMTGARWKRLPKTSVEQQTRKWTKYLTKVLVDLMVEELEKGGKEDNILRKKEWSYIHDEFRRKTSFTWEKEKLKNRCAVLKKQYFTVKSILHQDEFTLQESTGLIVATEEVWAEYIREHPDAESIQTRGCPIYKELCIIFGKLDRSNADEIDSELSSLEHSSTQPDNSRVDSNEVNQVARVKKRTHPSTSISSIQVNQVAKRERKTLVDLVTRGVFERTVALVLSCLSKNH